MNKWRPKGWGNPHPEEFMTKPEFRPRDAFEAGADVMYEAIREEIEKMKNPYPDTMAFRISHPVFEDCRQAILKALES